ncbi:TetR/AcrR family transcriptional regulator [Kribbella pratensis]|uniref:TetR family transcriptional regulator n=1 Tax=Kribbella pratensis TaxID=2512112 RepID=A0A4R8C1K7_9ACTN|nr:TetR/AcrR family transcriptional regulator [Kribbella pratensis]TDW69566.1 TetR family transcriptional regulator [Kribbella pratensis]
MDRPPIWLRPERAARGPRPAHSRDEIAAAAVRVADAEGLAAVSMRRVATELGTGTTSLYRYVDGKDELFDLMVDRAMGDGRPPVPTGNWRVDLAAVAHAQRAIMLRHPWLVRLPATRPVLGPNTLAWLEATYAAVDVPGLDADEVLAQAATLLTFVRGHALEELTEREAGSTMADWLTKQSQRYAEQVIGSGVYPHLSRMMIEAETPHAADRFDRLFARSLEHVLTGLAAGRG